MLKKSSPMRAREMFLSMLNDHSFQPGDKLPSEPKMAQMINVSRETWRSALELLRREGYISSKQGIGSFVLERPQKIPSDLSSLRSLSEMVHETDIIETSSEADIIVIPADDTLIDKLSLKPGDMVKAITRKRYSAKGMISSSINFIPLCYSEEMTESTLPSSLFQYFENQFDIVIQRSTTDLVFPEQEDPIAAPLYENHAKSVMALYQLHFDKKGNPIMYCLDYLNCDLFHFSVTRIRPN